MTENLRKRAEQEAKIHE
jgi:hypothetical protein